MQRVGKVHYQPELLAVNFVLPVHIAAVATVDHNILVLYPTIMTDI